jgi:hypothetical protein
LGAEQSACRTTDPSEWLSLVSNDKDIAQVRKSRDDRDCGIMAMLDMPSTDLRTIAFLVDGIEGEDLWSDPRKLFPVILIQHNGQTISVRSGNHGASCAEVGRLRRDRREQPDPGCVQRRQQRKTLFRYIDSVHGQHHGRQHGTELTSDGAFSTGWRSGECGGRD